MRRRVDVDAGLSGEHRGVAGLGLDDRRVTEVRRLLGGRGELGAELTEGQELRAVLDESEGRGVPEGRRPAVAEDDLVPLGQGEELGDAVAQPLDLGADRLLPVRRTQVGRGDRGERLDLGRADLARAGAEAPVGRLEVSRDLDRGGVDSHGSRLGGPLPRGRNGPHPETPSEFGTAHMPGPRARKADSSPSSGRASIGVGWGS